MIARARPHQEFQVSRHHGAGGSSQYSGVMEVCGGFMAACKGGLKGPFKTDIAAAVAVQESQGNYREAERLRRLLLKVRRHASARDLPRHVYRDGRRFKAIVRRHRHNNNLGSFGSADEAAAAAQAYLDSLGAVVHDGFDPRRSRRGMRFECAVCAAEFRIVPKQCPKCGSLKIEPLA